jgi:hypothetical protein
MWSSPIQAAAFGIGGQHDEVVGYQDGTVLEDVGVPDGRQEGCMEVRRSFRGTELCSSLCSDDDKLALCITEQRSGYQGAIRVYEMSHDGDCKNRESDVPRCVSSLTTS